MINLSLTVFILICAVILLLLYISFIQYRRAEKATNIADILMSNMSSIYDYIRESSQSLENPQLRQAFESDDEVGTFFKDLQNIQETLEQILPENQQES